MITRIEAYRYRCFEGLTLEIGPFQVLVGKNGAGKSTLLDIPILLGEILTQKTIHDPFFRPSPSHARPRADAPLDLIFNHRGDWFSLAVECRLPDQIMGSLRRTTYEAASKSLKQKYDKQAGRLPGGLRYELGVRIVSGALEVSHEFLFILPEDRSLLSLNINGLWGDQAEEDDSVRCIIRRTVVDAPRIRSEVPGSLKEIRGNVPPSTPALSGLLLDVDLFAASNWLQSYFSRESLPILLDLPMMRQAQLPPGRDWRVAANGSTLPWSVMELGSDPERYEEWIAHVQSALPLVESVEGRTREDDGLAYLEVGYSDGLKVKSSGLSDGTLSILALTILPFLKNVPTFVAVEEPENGIHPKAIEAVLESLSKVPQSQVWVSTHSPVAVAHTSPEHLLCMRQTRGEGVQVTRGSEHPKLREWQGTPSLATLFAAGVL